MTTRRVPIPIFDLHAHFPMQLPLLQRPCEVPPWTAFNRGLLGIANAAANFHRLRPRVSLRGAEDASVSFASVLFHPADEVWGPCEAFRNLLSQIAEVETAVQKRPGWQVARNPKELAAAMQANQRVIVHCVEGGFGVESPDNVPALADAGVAYVTLAHLIFREISACVNAFPFMSDDSFSKIFKMPVQGLTEVGADIAECLMKHGVVVDVTHMTETAFREVAAIANDRSRPIIASHTAPRETSSDKYLLNLSDEMMHVLKETGGVVGVIAFRHWLHDPSKPDEPQDLRIMLRAIEHVRKTVGDDHVAVGSDLDGFIEPVDGLERIGNMTRLRKVLLDHYDAGLVEKILWRNALRALHAGWTGR